MQLFYEPEFSTNGNILNLEESKHCIRVLRHKAGDIISIMDGKGNFYSAKIVDPNPKKCCLKIVELKTENRSSHSLHMAVAPTKNIDRFEWFLEKATEIGIEEITPIICEHSERKIIKPERLEKVITSAAKQSLKTFQPILNPIISFKQFINAKDNQTPAFIAHCYDTPKQHLKNCYKENSNAIILIGPEGDFSLNEIGLATANNFLEVSLGKARLRTETAAIMSCTTFNLINHTD